MATLGSMCNCAVCKNAAQPPNADTLDEKMKRLYTPPQPDSNTFATQQAFLESLTPVSIDSIDESSIRCPTCWKPYGEAADPGFDNSEQPVRLSCNHTFGDKCLRATYALPGTVTIALRPLTFAPGSRGRVLGQRLHAHIESQRSSTCNSHASRGFTKMLAAESLDEPFGEHWSSVISVVRRSMTSDDGFHIVTFLENGVILDRPIYMSELKQSFSSAPSQDYMPPLPHPPVTVSIPYQMATSTTGSTPPTTPPTYTVTYEFQQTPHPVVPLLSVDVPSSYPLNGSQGITPKSILNVTNYQLNALGVSFASDSSVLSAIVTDDTYAVPEDQLPAWKQLLAQECNLKKLIHDMVQTVKTQSPQELQKLVSLQEVQDILLPHITQLKVFYASEKTKAARREAERAHQQRLKEKADIVLAHALARVYLAYLEYLDHEGCTIAKAPDESTADLGQKYFVSASLFMHAPNGKESSFQIDALDEHIARFVAPYFQTSEPGDDAEENVAGELSTALLDSLFPVISRKNCAACFDVRTQMACPLPPPATLWWRRISKSPDDCAICHRILFLRCKARRRIQNPPCDVAKKAFSM